jgi:hypothetical protein
MATAGAQSTLGASVIGTFRSWYRIAIGGQSLERIVATSKIVRRFDRKQL